MATAPSVGFGTGTLELMTPMKIGYGRTSTVFWYCTSQAPTWILIAGIPGPDRRVIHRRFYSFKVRSPYSRLHRPQLILGRLYLSLLY